MPLEYILLIYLTFKPQVNKNCNLFEALYNQSSSYIGFYVKFIRCYTLYNTKLVALNENYAVFPVYVYCNCMAYIAFAYRLDNICIQEIWALLSCQYSFHCSRRFHGNGGTAIAPRALSVLI